MHCHASNLINDEGLTLLYDVNKPANPEFPCWKCPLFDLEKSCYNEYKAEFWFTKNNIYNLVDAFRIPNEVRHPNRHSIVAVGALCLIEKE